MTAGLAEFVYLLKLSLGSLTLQSAPNDVYTVHDDDDDDDDD